MPVHQFTFIVEGADLQEDERLDRLFEAGCDDSTVGSSEGIQYVAFDREAESFEDAVASARRDLETIGGVAVVEVLRDQEA